MKNTTIQKLNVYLTNKAILDNAKLNNEQRTLLFAQVDGLRKNIVKNVKSYYEKHKLFFGSKTIESLKAPYNRYEVFNRDSIITLQDKKIIDIVAVVRTRDDRRIKQDKKARYDTFYSIDLKTLQVKKEIKCTK